MQSILLHCITRIYFQMAADKNYGQSLFERLYDQFHTMEHSPVMMLTTQYRMHQDICMFPNKHVYGGLLSTDPWVYQMIQT